MRKPEFSEQLPELMGIHMKDFHLPRRSRSFLSRIWVVPRVPDFFLERREISSELGSQKVLYIAVAVLSYPFTADSRVNHSL